jgi:hypothetical protein
MIVIILGEVERQNRTGYIKERNSAYLTTKLQGVTLQNVSLFTATAMRNYNVLFRFLEFLRYNSFKLRYFIWK